MAGLIWKDTGEMVTRQELDELVYGGPIPEAEQQRRDKAVQRLKELLSTHPNFKDFREEDWVRFQRSQINLNY